MTIFAICKILSIATELSTYNENIAINKRTMIFHAVLLIVQSLASIVAAAYPYIPPFATHAIIIDINLTAVEVIV